MEREIARISAEEIIAAVAATDAPYWLQRVIDAAVHLPSRRLGRLLSRFDTEIQRVGMGVAAARFMSAMGARVQVHGSAPAGPALVVMNHPGAYDALALMTALGRDDVRFLARDRRFLRVLPNLSARMIFVSARGLRAALRHLSSGGVVVQLGAGAIEPEGELGEWPEGTGFLASHARNVVPAFVSGVHSPRAQHLSIVRWAEARGITTIGPLIQATMPGFRDVRVTLRFGLPIEINEAMTHAERTRHVRDAVRALGARR